MVKRCLYWISFILHMHFIIFLCKKQMNRFSKIAKMSLSTGAIVGYSILGTFCAYVVTSVVLLKWPTILHTKKKRHFYCSHISHRGGAAERLENTLSAYHHAIEAGTQMLELDVHLTKDRVVVVSHDGNLSRCTGESNEISDLNFEQLPILKDTLQVTFYGSHSCHNFGKKETIPSLEEVFKCFPDVPINLDIKAEGNEQLMILANDLIKKYDREKITVWGNFSDKTTSKLYKLNPNIPLLFSMRRVSLVFLWFYTGLLPFIPLKESYLEIPHPYCFKRTSFQMTNFQKRLFTIASFFLRSKVLFTHLKERGIPTYLWVLNEEEDFKDAFALNAEGVMTDCPTKLTEWLNENPQYWIGSRKSHVQ